MRTVLTPDPIVAAEFIRRGGIVAFPTETVYGLGAAVFDAEAVAKIFAAKRRPEDNPLIAHIAAVEQIGELAETVTKSAEKFIVSFFPGPLTIVLAKLARVPLIATAGLDTIGVRMPLAELAQRFLAACRVPVVAPSANLSGRPSPTTWEAVFEDLDGRIDCILQGEATEIGLESTIVDCTGDVPLLLRAGAVSLLDLQAVVPATRIYVPGANERPKSPGVLHRHYSPNANVRLVNFKFEIKDLKVEGENTAYIGSREPETRSLPLPALTRVCSSVEEYAHALFEFFRECDRAEIKTIYCETVEESGIGVALMDRLRRAAEE